MAYLLHLGVNLLDNLVGIRAGHLIDADVDTRTAVGLGNDVIVLRTQLHTGNVANAQHVAIGQRAYHQVGILLLLLIATSIFQHILERIVALGAQRTCGHLHVLFVQHLGDVGRRQSVLRHLQRVEPDAHRVVGTHHVNLAHAGYSAQTRLNINLCVVGQKGTVESAVGTVNGHLLDVAGLTLSHRQSALHHVTRQSALHGGGTVLNVHHRHVGVGTLTEEDTYRGSTIVRGARRHIHHTLHAVDGFLQRHHHALLHRLGIGTGIRGHDSHRGWCYLRKLLQRQPAQSDDAHQHHQHAYHSGKDWPINKCPNVHHLSPFTFHLSPQSLLSAVLHPRQ